MPSAVSHLAELVIDCHDLLPPAQKVIRQLWTLLLGLFQPLQKTAFFFSVERHLDPEKLHDAWDVIENVGRHLEQLSHLASQGIVDLLREMKLISFFPHDAFLRESLFVL